MAGRIYEGFVPGRHQIDAYGNGGFRFADMSHRGSILALPSGIRAWDVAAPEGFSLEAFAPVFADGEGVEILLVGTGRDVARFPADLRRRFREAGIGLDVMQTGAAARTYNVLVAENRRVGAALIAVD
ncbi:MAG TPA: MTH938/NDUFAF3 family protein [Microvirga sp.]|jgi:uncharacterized protein|nr:MTH938/NDUFAF3 family protein [Microvirga sp.]